MGQWVVRGCLQPRYNKKKWVNGLHNMGGKKSVADNLLRSTGESGDYAFELLDVVL